MKVGVYCNKNAKKFLPIQKALFSLLKDRGIPHAVYYSVEEIGAVDALIVLGGDGTILKTAIEAGKRGIVLLGINAGTLGFLTEFEGEQVRDAVSLLESSFETEQRSVLEICVNDDCYYALNDAVFQRSYDEAADNNVVSIGVEIDGKKVDDIVGDGIIVSTPTGSTAYSLSAGGSILTPDIAAFILTPVCAHSLHNRPIVYADTSELRMFLNEEGAALSLFADGRHVCNLRAEDRVQLRKASFCVKFIKNPNSNFFDKLLFKLNKWSR